VHGALMIEPTETESKLKPDLFIDAMILIAKEAGTSRKPAFKGTPLNADYTRG
jgi:glycine cleavage system protein P-like pyridoxal-binding family